MFFLTFTEPSDLQTSTTTEERLESRSTHHILPWGKTKIIIFYPCSLSHSQRLQTSKHPRPQQGSLESGSTVPIMLYQVVKLKSRNSTPQGWLTVSSLPSLLCSPWVSWTTSWSALGGLVAPCNAWSGLSTPIACSLSSKVSCDTTNVKPDDKVLLLHVCYQVPKESQDHLSWGNHG